MKRVAKGILRPSKSSWDNDSLRVDVELSPLTDRDKRKLLNAKSIMDKIESETPKKLALHQLELHEKANKAEELQKEITRLKDTYRIISRDYNQLVEECVKLKLSLAVYEFKPTSLWQKIKLSLVR